MRTIKVTLVRKVIVCIFAFYSSMIFSQIGIGTEEPSNQSSLDIRSTDKGLLIPRLTTTERTTLGDDLTNANNSNNKGMQVFDTVTNSIWYWNGSAWSEVADTSSLSTDNYVEANPYKANDLVIRNNRIYQANAAIPANTSFAIGTTGATWKKISAIPEWTLAGVYETGDVVKKDGLFFEANNDIPNNTAFQINTTGTTWRALTGVAEYGSVIIPSQTTAGLTGSYVDVTSASINLPSAGVFQITFDVGYSANSGNYVGFGLYTTSNVLVQGSPNEAKPVALGEPNRMSKTIQVTVSEPTIYKLKVTSYGGATVTIGNSSTNQSVLTFKKIAGFLPSTIALTNGKVSFTGSTVNFNNGIQTAANSSFSLSAGTYLFTVNYTVAISGAQTRAAISVTNSSNSVIDGGGMNVLGPHHVYTSAGKSFVATLPGGDYKVMYGVDYSTDSGTLNFSGGVLNWVKIY